MYCFQEDKMAEVEQKKRASHKFTYCVWTSTSCSTCPTSSSCSCTVPAQEAALIAQVAEQGQKGGPAHGEARGGGQPGGRVQRQDVNQVEIKPEMICHYVGEFSITYKLVKHGWPSISATHSSCFIPFK